MSKEREVLKLARDVLLPYKSTGLRWYTDVDKALDAIEEVLAQREEQRSCDKQEPVGMRWRWPGYAWVYVDEIRSNVVGNPEMELLYTTQPQRTWVGLTDEERLEAAEIDGADEWFWKVCKAIEAKLKEKNT